MHAPFGHPSPLTLRSFAASLLLCVATGCTGSDARPCSDCPDVAGAWQWTFEQTPLPGPCQALGRAPPAAPLVLTQVGSGLRGEADGVPLQGTLYDTWDLSLSGGAALDGGTRSVTVFARYAPPRVDVSDGGTDVARLEGNYSEQTGAGAADAGCSFLRTFSAERALER